LISRGAALRAGAAGRFKQQAGFYRLTGKDRSTSTPEAANRCLQWCEAIDRQSNVHTGGVLAILDNYWAIAIPTLTAQGSEAKVFLWAGTGSTSTA